MTKKQQHPDIKMEFWPIDLIKPYELNSKKHDKAQVAKIAQSISKFGFDQPIVVDSDGVIIKGHGRRLACIELGLKTVPVLVRGDLTPEQVKAARVADNRVAVGDIDTEMLKLELADLDLDDLRGIFDDKELDFMTADLGAINESAFVTDLDAVVDEQRSSLEEKIDGAGEKRVPIAKALGFKDIAAGDQFLVTKLMAQVEAQTGMKGDQALMAFLRTLFAVT